MPLLRPCAGHSLPCSSRSSQNLVSASLRLVPCSSHSSAWHLAPSGALLQPQWLCFCCWLCLAAALFLLAPCSGWCFALASSLLWRAPDPPAAARPAPANTFLLPGPSVLWSAPCSAQHFAPASAKPCPCWQPLSSQQRALANNNTQLQPALALAGIFLRSAPCSDGTLPWSAACSCSSQHLALVTTLLRPAPLSNQDVAPAQCLQAGLACPRKWCLRIQYPAARQKQAAQLVLGVFGWSQFGIQREQRQASPPA